MKKVGYYLFKWWIGIGLCYYFSTIKIHGLENIPKNKPVLFLANHQNALLDALLVAVFCKRKPYYLTRASVFKSPIVISLLNFLQMIPIYRIRDGINSLANNDVIFEKCSDLLRENEHILIFPEGSHNIKKRVRPLSKGFTRILFRAMEKQPELDIKLIPIGINYIKADSFPDSTALFFDKEISLLNLFDKNKLPESINKIKKAVSDSLENTTTHIDDEENYHSILHKLNSMKVDYLEPSSVNTILTNKEVKEHKKKRKNLLSGLLKVLFIALNIPFLIPWKLFVKPRIREIEFLSTFRFMYALLFYPIIYLMLFLFLEKIIGYDLVFIVLLGHILFNRMYIKLYPFTT